MSKNDLVSIHLRITPEMKEMIESHSKLRGLSQNAIIVFALETYFTQQAVIPHLEELIEESKALRERQEERFMTQKKTKSF